MTPEFFMPLLTAAVSGGGVGWATTFLGDRSKSRAYTMGAVDASVKAALESTTAEIIRLNKAHNECLEHNELMRKDMAELRQNIDSLMSGKVPGYVIGPS